MAAELPPHRLGIDHIFTLEKGKNGYHVIKKEIEKGQHDNVFVSIAHGISTEKGFEYFLTICVKQNNRGDDPKIMFVENNLHAKP